MAGICTTVSVLPQIRKAWKTKEVEDVSPGMFGILMLGVFLWVIYGILKNDLPIIATNGASLALNSVMFYLMIRYRKKDR
ncbi:MAG: SemiSWEET transporter [Salegentibacter sp.]